MRRGFTLGEALVSLGLFSVLSITLFMVLRAGTGAWLRVDTRNDAEASMRTIETNLLRDLEQACSGPSAANISIARVGVGDGFALWFQTPIYYDSDGNTRVHRDPLTGNLYGADNVLYYAIRPSRHEAVAHGYDCQVEGGDSGTNTTPGPEGDRYCPHKMVIRKVIHATELLDVSTILTYCTRPSGYSLNAMASEPNLELSHPAPRFLGHVLTFWPSIEAASRRVTVNLVGFGTREAERTLKVGGSRMDTTPFAVPHRIRLFPYN